MQTCESSKSFYICDVETVVDGETSSMGDYIYAVVRSSESTLTLKSTKENFLINVDKTENTYSYSFLYGDPEQGYTRQQCHGSISIE